MSSDIPRRAYLERLTPAETTIRDAILEVESLDADVRLTDAVILLQAAKDSVGDYVDGYEHTWRSVIVGPSKCPAEPEIRRMAREEVEERSFMSSNVLTPEEEEIIRNASIASSCEIDQLLAIIQRLVKRIEWLTLPPRDRPKYSTAILDGSSIDRPLFSDRAESEIRRIAREVAREEVQKYKDDEEVPF